MKLGICTADFSGSIHDETGHPVWGGSGWARLGQYITYLPYDISVGMPIGSPEEGGRTIGGLRGWSNSVSALHNVVGGITNGGWNGADEYGFEVLYLQRFMLRELANDIPKFRQEGQVVLNDLDDWYWGIDPTNKAFATLNIYDNENLSYYKRVLSASNAVSVSTKYLADRIMSWCKAPIEVVGNTVDFDTFATKIHTDNPPVIGWAGSVGHRSRDLETLSGILSQMETLGCTFRHLGHFGGAATFAELAGVSEDKVEVAPMMAPQEYKLSLNFDIGLVPLRDTPFNHAKSNIKGLEYVAANVPFVAPAFGEYKRLHDEFGVGRIAKNPKQWVQHLKALMDPEVRTEEARLNRERAASFSTELGAKRLEAFIEAYRP